MIDTGKVKDRRSLHFQSVDDVVADVDRIVNADKAETLRRTGNWTAGQIMGHLASWINYSYEGYPMKTPWFIRIILRFMKKKYLRNGMPAGVKIPGTAEGTFGMDLVTTEQGAQNLRQALERLRRGEPSKFDSPAFGPMPLEERIALNLRHAELHLSFLQF